MQKGRGITEVLSVEPTFPLQADDSEASGYVCPWRCTGGESASAPAEGDEKTLEIRIGTRTAARFCYRYMRGEWKAVQK